MPRREPGKHRAPGRHSARKPRPNPLNALTPLKGLVQLKPTLAAVTCASVGVAGVGVTAAVVATAQDTSGGPNTLLANDVAGGGLTDATKARLTGKQPAAAPGPTDTSDSSHLARTKVAFEEPQTATGKASFDRIQIERRRAQDRATRDADRILDEGTPKEIAKLLVIERGWSERQYSECLVPMWKRESNWNPDAHNSSSGAHGIAQALPGRKMAKFGDDWETNAETQIRWGLWYIESRYDTPCGAWSFWKRNHWY